MTVSSLTSASTLATKDQLWLFAELFRNDWSDGVEVSRGYKTNIYFALTKAEQRYGLSSKPVHSMTVTLRAGLGSRREVVSLQSIARRQTIAKSPWPLLSDEIRSTGSWASGSQIIPCDPSKARLFVGKRVLFVPLAGEDGPYYSDQAGMVVATITAIGESSITVESTAAQTYAAGARIFPLIEARLQFSLQGRIDTDLYQSLRITVTEEEGATQLPGMATVGSNPAGMQLHDGLPIFFPDYDYSDEIQWGFEREGERSTTGLAGISTVYGSRGLFTCSFSLNCFTKAEAFDLIRFFDSRGGKLYPFWFCPPTNDYYNYQGSTTGNTQFIVSCGGIELDWSFRPYVFIRKYDGTIYVREVQSALRTGNETYLITLTEALPETVGANDAERVGVAYLARFNTDEMTEQWESTEVMSCSFGITELEEDKEITIEDITEISTSDLEVEYQITECAQFTYIYALTNCDMPSDIIYSEDDLEEFVGQTIILTDDDNKCRTVSKVMKEEQSLENVEVSIAFGDCECCDEGKDWFCGIGPHSAVHVAFDCKINNLDATSPLCPSCEIMKNSAALCSFVGFDGFTGALIYRGYTGISFTDPQLASHTIYVWLEFSYTNFFPSGTYVYLECRPRLSSSDSDSTLPGLSGGTGVSGCSWSGTGFGFWANGSLHDSGYAEADFDGGCFYSMTHQVSHPDGIGICSNCNQFGTECPEPYVNNYYINIFPCANYLDEEHGV